MKNLLIIYPHWPPSNLAGVHRPRLIANFLTHFNWKPIVVTVKSDYYEEKPDWDMIKLVSKNVEVHYTKAFKVTTPRIIGDIGLRAFFQLLSKSLEIIKEKDIDFIWIPIPSFYTALLGRIIYEKTNIPYGIDYIDPWVYDITNIKGIRAKLSNIAAKTLEPIAIKKASVISGVSTEYFLPAINRNFKNKHPELVAMPYGFDPNDHNVNIENLPLPWSKYPGCKPIVYAGAFLPLSGYFIKTLFESIDNLRKLNKFDENIKLFFLGTGFYNHKSIKAYAQEYHIDDIVIEERNRYPFLHILNFLSKSYGVLVVGSTEKHYTASKIFQSILSKRPVFSIFHKESSAVKILQECNADTYTVTFNEKIDHDLFQNKVQEMFCDFVYQNKSWEVLYEKLDSYSAKQSARKLINSIEKMI